MNSTPDAERNRCPESCRRAGRADERLAHAYEEIKRADEQLTRMSEQLAKMEGDAARPAAAATWPAIAARASSRATAHASITCASTPTARIASESRRPEPHGFAAGGGLRCHCPGLVGLWRRDCRPLGAAARFNAVIAAGRSDACRAVRAIHRSGGRGGDTHRPPEAAPPQATPPQATSLAQAQTAPQDARHRRRAASSCSASRRASDQAQLLQKIARDLATLERNIEQLKANQQQMASDNSKAIGELKASQEEMKRTLAKTSEPTPPKASSPPAAQPAPVVRRPERTYQPPQARARPRYYPRESGTTTIGSRRRGDRSKFLSCNNARRDTERGAPSGIPSRRRGLRKIAPRPAIRFSHLASAPHPTCQFREAGAACSHG